VTLLASLTSGVLRHSNRPLRAAAFSTSTRLNQLMEGFIILVHLLRFTIDGCIVEWRLTRKENSVEQSDGKLYVTQVFNWSSTQCANFAPNIICIFSTSQTSSVMMETNEVKEEGKRALCARTHCDEPKTSYSTGKEAKGFPTSYNQFMARGGAVWEMSDSRKDARAEIWQKIEKTRIEKPDEATRENGVKHRNYSAWRQSLVCRKSQS
jgi:hypothetical protein